MNSIAKMTPQEILELLKKVDKITWIRVAGAGAGAAVFIYFILIPAWFERPQVRAQIQAVEGQIAQTQTLLVKRPLLLKNKQEFSAMLEEAKNRLYEPGESSMLLGSISKLATESNVAVVASKPKDTSAKFPVPFDARYEGKGYDFTVEGGYHQLGDFVSRIERNRKFLRIESFNVKPRAENPVAHLADLTLSAVSSKTSLAAAKTGAK